MKKIIIVLLAGLFTANLAFADHASCEAKAAEKNLRGAAKASFIKKCERETNAPMKNDCAAQAAEKKLAGAAKANFMKKCQSATPAK